jgi:hypothetical protein
MNFVTTNDSMRWILAIVLSVGNHMNQATVRGNALGFRIDALSKLITTKWYCTIGYNTNGSNDFHFSTGENSNMLQFVVHRLSKCAVHCLEFPQQVRCFLSDNEMLMFSIDWSSFVKCLKEDIAVCPLGYF